jgi:YidC/Oxa1 family membrane protein insertase
LEKRLQLALILSFLILFGWSLVFKPPAQPRPADPAGAPPSSASTGGAPATADARDGAVTAVEGEPAKPVFGPIVREETEREVTLLFGGPDQRGGCLATFSNRGAVLKELRLAQWYDTAGLDEVRRKDPAHWTVLLQPAGGNGSLALRSLSSSAELSREPLEQALWTMKVLGSEDAPTGVEFELAPGTGMRFVKRIVPVPGTYHLAVELEFHNEALPPGGARTVQFELTPAEAVPLESADSFYVEPQALAAGREDPEDPLELVSQKPHLSGPPGLKKSFPVPAEPLAFAGVHNKYFAALLSAGGDLRNAYSLKGAIWRPVLDEAFMREHPHKASSSLRMLATDVLIGFDLPAQGERQKLEYQLYAGPKDRGTLVEHNPDYVAVIDEDLKSVVPFVASIARLLVWFLGGLERLTHNWGVAIILLTLCVRAILFPINRRSQTALARYQTKIKRLQPKIDEIKARFAKDPQKLRQEHAALMQREGAFPPLGGCLPLFLQLPVFFGLFQALRTSIDLRQAPFFGWVTDLAKPDRLMRLDIDLPLIGTIEYLNVLPPLMVVLWILQQRTMPKPTDEQQARMQRMMMFMPIVMGFFLYNYAAGLSLYMITQSLLGVIEMTVIKKRWPVDDRELPPKKEGFLQRLAEKQMEQKRRLAGMKPRRSMPPKGRRPASR